MQVLLLRGVTLPRLLLLDSPYLDAHGETDIHLRRGRALTLSVGVYAHLSRLWADGALNWGSTSGRATMLWG
jgi:hypothetical protein